MSHISVLHDEVIAALLPEDHKVVRAIDGTLGAGGHCLALLERGVQEILAFDLDPQAIATAREKLADYSDRVEIVHASYLTMREEAQRRGWDGVDAILLDLGVSSMQMDTPERGFAFKHDAPLDMRFDPNSTRPTAAELLNSMSENELAVIFYRYGEEKHSRRIAQRIIKQRPIETTKQLATLVEEAVPRRKKGQSHPATRIFQALRIAVNEELQVVEDAIPMAIDLLNPGGRLAVISFHSLEDRIVKQCFKEASTEIVAPPGMGSIEEQEAIVRLVNRKPIVPGDAELADNPRSRSSKLRVVEKI